MENRLNGRIVFCSFLPFCVGKRKSLKIITVFFTENRGVFHIVNPYCSIPPAFFTAQDDMTRFADVPFGTASIWRQKDTDMQNKLRTLISKGFATFKQGRGYGFWRAKARILSPVLRFCPNTPDHGIHAPSFFNSFSTSAAFRTLPMETTFSLTTIAGMDITP